MYFQNSFWLFIFMTDAYGHDRDQCAWKFSNIISSFISSKIYMLGEKKSRKKCSRLYHLLDVVIFLSHQSLPWRSVYEFKIWLNISLPKKIIRMCVNVCVLPNSDTQQRNDLQASYPSIYCQQTNKNIVNTNEQTLNKERWKG